MPIDKADSAMSQNSTEYEDSHPAGLMSFNQTSTPSERVMTTRATPWIAMGGVVLVLLILVTLIGNFVVVRAVFTYRQLKNHHSNWFIVNLALADILVNFVTILSLVAITTDTNESIPMFGKVGNIKQTYLSQQMSQCTKIYSNKT